VFLFLF